MQELFAADTILVNARIHTMDAANSVNEAIAIRDGEVVAVGSTREMSALAGLNTQMIDHGGNTIIPGLIDAHNHLQATGRVLQQISLYDCRSIGEIVERVARQVARSTPGEWILGRGWDESLLVEGRHPNRHDLDAVAPNNPVVLHRVWNKLVANSMAMQRANVSAATPDPSPDVAYSGSFERDSEGRPTGLFRDRAKELIVSCITAESIDDRVRAIDTACRAYNEVGLTAVAEPGLYPDEIRAFHEAQRRGLLTVRTDMLMAAWGFNEGVDDLPIESRLLSVGVQGGFGDKLLRIGGVKIMPDGGVGDRTAKMFEPYLNELDNRGLWVVDPEQIARGVKFAHDLGYSIDTHTCGDEAQQVVVQAYADAQTANPKPWLRHRVHHAYLPTAKTMGLMAKHQIAAVVSNPFITNLGESYVLSLGEERAARMMPMRSYLDAGVPLAGSSDSSVSDYNPWVGMYAATTRKTVTGRVLGESERITALDALRSYTMGGAWATGREDWLGSLEPGKRADLVVLEVDPLEIAPDELKKVKPLATMVHGDWVYQRT